MLVHNTKSLLFDPEYNIIERMLDIVMVNMPSYEILDCIADSYIPILLTICIIYLGELIINRRWITLKYHTSTLALYIFSAYAIMVIDIKMALWHLVGLDYSTHTAVSLSLVIWLSYKSTSLLIIWWTSLLAYFILMLYQQYHSVADIISTSLPLGLLLWICTSLWHNKSMRLE